MIISPLSIPGAAVVTFTPHIDDRGEFCRIFCADELAAFLQGASIVQINYSSNLKKGTVRGLHFQYPPKKEMKLICCRKGCAYDVIVDIRKNSKTFLQWEGIELSADNYKMIVVPPWCAHGFQTLFDETELIYFHTDYYAPEYDGGLSIFDPLIGIQWPIPVNFISERDLKHPYITQNFHGI